MARYTSTLLPAGLIVLAVLASRVMGASFQVGTQADAAEAPGGLVRRGATMNNPSLWPGATIPYILHGLPWELSEAIRGAMRTWEQQTCIRFVPKEPSHTAWIRYTKHDDRCHTKLGYQGNNSGETIVNLDVPNQVEQIISLNLYRGCMEKGKIIRRIGRLIGLINEHQRSDREQFVHVIISRVEKEHRDEMVALRDTDTSQPYDYTSVMHASTRAHSSGLGFKETIKTRDKKKPIKPGTKPSREDFQVVNRAYRCTELKNPYLPDCVSATPGRAENNMTSFSFVVDKHTVSWMRTQGFDHLAVRGDCHAAYHNRKQNWKSPYGSVPLGSSTGGDGQPFRIEGLPRCPYGDLVSYEVRMCKTAQAGNRVCEGCRGTDDGRKLCQPKGERPFQAAAVTDPNLWVCHQL